MEVSLIELLNTRDNSSGYNMSKGGTGGNQKEIYAIKQYDLNANLIAEYNSAAECSRILGINRTHITRCCKHGGKTANYMFCYANQEITEPYKRKTQKDIYQFNLNGELIKKYRTFNEVNTKDKSELNALKKATNNGKTHFHNGFIWLYEENIINLSDYIFSAKLYLDRNNIKI